jgi:hypothetical protein
LKELGQLKGQEVLIILEDDNPIFKRPYRLNAVERTLVQARMVELLDVGLVELSRGEYVLTKMMPTTKDIFGNWTKRHMCGDYRLMNKRTHSKKYAMPLLEEIFNALGQTKVFSTLDLRSSYHMLPLREGDKVKTTFWGIDPHGKDCLYQWKFLPFGLKNAPLEFQRGLSVVKSWICQMLH